MCGTRVTLGSLLLINSVPQTLLLHIALAGLFHDHLEPFAFCAGFVVLALGDALPLGAAAAVIDHHVGAAKRSTPELVRRAALEPEGLPILA